MMFRKTNRAEILRLSTVCLTLGSCCFAGLRPVRAQSPATVKQFETQAHTGPVEKTLVGVEVSGSGQNGGATARHGNGVVIRCDGFVLTSQALFGATVNGAAQNVTVTLNPGTAEAKRVSARVVGTAQMLRRAFAGKPEPLVVLKIADIHTPALRLLLPEAVAAEKEAVLAWSAWDASGEKFLPIQKRAVALADPAQRALKANNRLAFARPEAVPLPGAILIGPEGMGIGLTTNAAPSISDAASFETLNSLTNCVTPQSATDAQFALLSSRTTGGENVLPMPAPNKADNGADQETPQANVKSGAQQQDTKDGTETANAAQTPNLNSMVRIAGGAVGVNALLREYQADMSLVRTACVAPFLIDRYEVTNAQYQKFWQSLSVEDQQKRRAELYPVAWAGNEPPFPKELDNVPVLGVPLAGAQAYAAWAGKRLPTPYEWCLAAFGPNGGTRMPEWVNRYVADRQTTWSRIAAAHHEYMLQNPGVHHTGIDPLPSGDAESTLPWLFWYSFETPHVLWSHNTILAMTAHLWQDWKDPQHILPVGSRKFDASPYGVMDMVFNGAEIVMPGQMWTSMDQGGSADYYIQVGFPNLSLEEHKALLGDLGGYGPRAVHLEVVPAASTQTAMPLSVLPEPLPSRRLRGPVTLGTTDSDLYAAYRNVSDKLREVSDMMAPIGGGVVGIAPGPQRLWLDYAYFTASYRRDTAFDFRQRYGRDYIAGSQQDITTVFNNTAWFRLWSTTPLPEHREIGRDVTAIPLAAPPLTPQQDPTLATYLVPGGFRCVR